MEKVLLIISDGNLRQLYHELLLSKNIEVIPCHAIEDAIVMLTLTQIETAIIFADESNNKEVEMFLRLYQVYEKWQRIKIILLTFNDAVPQLHENIFLVKIDENNPDEVVSKVKGMLTH